MLYQNVNMDNSQNSDSMIEDCPPISNSATYKILLTKSIKFLTTENILIEPAFAQKFISCLEDCCICVCQCLEFTSSAVEAANIQSVQLQCYLGDAIFLLQKLSFFLKNFIESNELLCANLKTFPITTGQIILNIFTHCKDSEHLYGNHLKVVETELKDLFRSCNELQHTYLIILEKNFVFDMMDEEQKYILLKALNINLKISEIVRHLDLKTLAEQLKAYTGICNKYSDSLLDKDIYNQYTELLCDLIDYNLKIALKINQQDTIIVRSLKVASFAIKILLKVSHIFKHGITNKYENILQTLIYIHMCDGAILRGLLNKSPQFISQVDLYILKTTQDLLSHLFLDRRFLDCLLKYDIRKVSEDRQLGLILLLISTIKCSVQNTEAQNSILLKNKLIDYVFNFIPYSQIWLNSGLMFNIKDGEEPQSLEEHLLAHSVALLMCLNGEEFAALERKLCGAVLSDNGSIALFSSRLWVLLARVADTEYTLTTVISLCKIYENLETNVLFNISPQEIQLGQTICRLFEILPNNYKVLVAKQYEIQDIHYSLWTFIKIKNLPENIRVATEDALLEKLLFELNKLVNTERYVEHDMRQLIKIIKITSTCPFTDLNPQVEDSVVKAWMRACPKNLFSLPSNIDCGVYWYYAYVEALVLLTNRIIEQFVYFENVFTVFHVLSELILTGNNELILLLMPMFCKISLYFFADENGLSIDLNTNETFKYLLNKTEPLVQQYTLGELVKYIEEKKFKSMVGKIIDSCPELQNTWQQILDTFNHKNINERNKQWMLFADCTYKHKCMDNKFALEDSSDRKQLKSNFEIDIDHIFGCESDAEEPASKKVKLEYKESNEIIRRLENDSLLLTRSKISEEYKSRIVVVCDRLRNIIS